MFLCFFCFLISLFLYSCFLFFFHKYNTFSIFLKIPMMKDYFGYFILLPDCFSIFSNNFSFLLWYLALICSVLYYWCLIHTRNIFDYWLPILIKDGCTNLHTGSFESVVMKIRIDFGLPQVVASWGQDILLWPQLWKLLAHLPKFRLPFFVVQHCIHSLRTFFC